MNHASVFPNALLGSLVADAVSMPVHWYYDTSALDADYGVPDRCLAPRNPHPGSILWRSRYQPLNEQGEILHDQAPYWGQRGIHYHQFLRAGENTLNYQIAAELYRWVLARGGYEADAWLEHYIKIMQTPGWHRDTYVEEVHRGFFTNLARGRSPRRCAVADLHIGALCHIPALLAALAGTGTTEPSRRCEIVATHVGLTHRHPEAAAATLALVQILEDLADGGSLRDSILNRATRYTGRRQLESWEPHEDRHIVGGILSPACYLPESMTAALYLCWKYHEDFSAGVIANARVGGDNCHRGAVVGSLLGAACGVSDAWRNQLIDPVICEA